MAVTHASAQATQFVAAIIRGLDRVLARLRAAQESLPAQEERSLAVHVLDFALQVDDAWTSAREVLLTLAPEMEQAGHREDWRPFLERGIRVSQTQADRRAEAELRFQLGVLHQRRARFDDAFAEFEASADLCAALGDEQGQARALNRQAYISIYLQHRPDRARFLIDRASALSADDGERAYSNLVEGFIALAQREWEDAVSQFERALDHWRACGDQRMVARTLLSLGPVLRELHRHDEAINCYYETVQLCELLGDPVALATAEMNWGNSCSVMGNLQEALVHYTAAESIFRHIQDDLHLAKLHVNQGIVYRKLQNPARAAEALCLAVDGWQRLGNVREWVNALDELGLVYQAMGKTDQAIGTFQEALAQLGALRANPTTYNYLCSMVDGHLQAAKRDLFSVVGDSDE